MQIKFQKNSFQRFFNLNFLPNILWQETKTIKMIGCVWYDYLTNESITANNLNILTVKIKW